MECKNITISHLKRKPRAIVVGHRFLQYLNYFKSNMSISIEYIHFEAVGGRRELSMFFIPMMDKPFFVLF